MNAVALNRLWAVLLVLLIGAAPAAAQDIGPPTDYVSWDVALEPETVAPGGEAVLRLEATIDAGWKMYALDSPPPSRGLRVRFQDVPEGLAPGEPQQIEPKEGYDPNFDIDVRYFEERAALTVPLRVTEGATGILGVEGYVEYMICNPRLCLPPTRAPFELQLFVEGTTGGDDAQGGDTQQGEAGAFTAPSLRPDAAPSLVPEGADDALDPTRLVTWTAGARPEAVAPGGTLTFDLTADIAEGWRLYALDSPRPKTRPVRLLWDDLPAGLSETAVRQAEPTRAFDEVLGVEASYFLGTAQLQADLLVPEDAAPGSYEASGQVEYVICSDRLCLPPTRVPVAAAFQVDPDGALAAEGPVLGAATPATVRASTTADLDAARSGGLWAFLMLAMGAGLAALLTPCVFPMIPLTVSYFTKHADDRGQAVRMAGTYGLAIVGTFTALGLLMAVFVGAAGAQTIAANPWINLFLAAVLVVFGLSLLGLFELRLPNGVLNYVNRQGTERAGYVGVLFMGLTLTLVSFSCTVPFVGGLLAAASGGEWSYPVLGMLAFSTMFALPFVVFALFPRALNALPKSGSWMNAVKVTLGFVELAAAIKFLSNVDLVWGWGIVTRPLAIAFTIVIFFLAGLYLIGKLRLAHDAVPETVGVGRLMVATLFFGVALYMVPGLLGAPLGRIDAFLPPRMGTDPALALAGGSGASAQTAGLDEEAWFTDDIDGAFAEARAQGKPVFIDFTGYTCTNCREMEANVFPRAEVAERFERDFVLLRVYTDDLTRGREFQRYQLDLTGTVALPTYVVVDPFEERVLERVSGLMPTDEFVAFLDEGTRAFADAALAMR